MPSLYKTKRKLLVMFQSRGPFDLMSTAFPFILVHESGHATAHLLYTSTNLLVNFDYWP